MSTTSLGDEPIAISPDDYNRFIGQIQLADIWLKEASVQNHHGPNTPERVEIHIHPDAGWEPQNDGFIATHRYTVYLDSAEARSAEVEVAFDLYFMSQQPMTDELFGIFAEVNLPLNTWPYLREFLGSVVGRMNWVPFTLPALKRGPNPDRSNPSSSLGKTRKQRSRHTNQ